MIKVYKAFLTKLVYRAPVLDLFQVFLVRKIVGKDAGKLYAMKVLKKASLKGG